MTTPADVVEAGLIGSEFLGAVTMCMAFVMFVGLGIAWMKRAGAQT